MMKKIAEILIPLSIVCGLIVFSFFVGEFLYSKINLFPNVESKSFQKNKSHKDTCVKCKKYEQELFKKGLMEP